MMIVAGLGCRSGTAAGQIRLVLEDACEAAGITLASVTALATGEIRREEPGMVELAASLGLTLHILNDEALIAAGPRTRTVSGLSLARTATPSLSEAAALAAAGEASELILPRVAGHGATCALAQSKDAA